MYYTSPQISNSNTHHTHPNQQRSYQCTTIHCSDTSHPLLLIQLPIAIVVARLGTYAPARSTGKVLLLSVQEVDGVCFSCIVKECVEDFLVVRDGVVVDFAGVGCFKEFEPDDCLPWLAGG